MNRKNWIVVSACLLGAVLVCLVLMWTSDPKREAAGLARSDNPDDRIRAVELLRGAGGNDARETLTNLAGDESLKVSLAAVAALGASDDQSFVQPLRDILANAKADPRLRGRAAAGLGRFKSTTIEELANLLRDPARPVRIGAVEGLRRKRDRAAVEPLLRAMDDPDRSVRSMAAEALNDTVGVGFMFDLDAPSPQRRARIDQIRRQLAQPRFQPKH